MEKRQEEIQYDTVDFKRESKSGINAFDTGNKKKTDHAKISARLKELSKLEEQDELNKSINSKSSVSLQGKGWSKGFLSQKNRRCSRKQKTKPFGDYIDTENELETKKSTSVKQAIVESPQNKGNRHVKFVGQDQVREISRDGNTATSNFTNNYRTQNVICDEAMSGYFVQKPSTYGRDDIEKVVSVGTILE